MASSSSSAAIPTLLSNTNTTRGPPHRFFTRHHSTYSRRNISLHDSKRKNSSIVCAKHAQKSALQYKKLGDSDLNISEITIGTMTFGEQNTEKEAHEMLSYAFEHGINILDTAEVYPVPPRKETQGRTDLYVSSWLKSQSRDKVWWPTRKIQLGGQPEKSSSAQVAPNLNCEISNLDTDTCVKWTQSKGERILMFW